LELERWDAEFMCKGRRAGLRAEGAGEGAVDIYLKAGNLAWSQKGQSVRELRGYIGLPEEDAGRDVKAP
jgi:hypothetical protein